MRELRGRVLAASPASPPALDEAERYLAQLDDAAFASLSLRTRQGGPIIQPRGGFARFEDQRRLTLALVAAGADFVPLTIDSHTRHNDYLTAATLLELSNRENANLLNGYPLVCHGYQASRPIYDNVAHPISLRHGTADARLLVEIALATGITEIEGGAITYTVPYSRTFPLERAILHWQYVDRLCALLSTPQRPINRESFGVLTATMLPPAMVAAVEICELLLAAEQGVTSYSLSFGQSGSILQDAALALVIRETAARYLTRFGFPNVTVHLVYHQWMGAFPREFELASALIAASAQTAALVRADKIITKTKEEARGIPSIEANAEGVRAVRYIVERTADTGLLDSAVVAAEAVRVTRTVDAIMEALFALPPVQFWRSVSQAFASGLIDIPFSPHEGNRNKLVTRRGRGNGIYITEPGQVPIPADVLAEERAAIAERSAGAADGSVFRTVMRDLEFMLA
jgi:methylaspartate mutase epsilon subunit